MATTRKRRGQRPAPIRKRRDHKSAITRAEFNRLIDVTNQSRDRVNDLDRKFDIQFQRIAQLQAELDAVKRR